MCPPAIPPTTDDELSDEARELLAKASIDGRDLNIFRTLAHHPKLFKRWLVFATHILSKSSLSPRDREILILRTGWLCRSEYEWGQHVLIAKREGLTDRELRQIAEGPGSEGLAQHDDLLLRAVDELHARSRLSDETWQELAAIFDRHQLMDLVFTVGQYSMLAMALSSFGVELDSGVPTFLESVGGEPVL